jgi:hypothetical protein
MDDSHELEEWSPSIRLVEEWHFTEDPDLAKLSLWYRAAYRLAGAFRAARQAHRIVYYQL